MFKIARYFFLFFVISSVAQTQKMDSIRATITLPIKNKAGFTKVQKLGEVIKNTTFKKNLTSEINIESYFNSADSWGETNVSLKELTRNKLYLLFWYSAQKKDPETLRLGSLLLTKEHFFSVEEMRKLILCMYHCYKRLEANLELLKLAPFIEKYVEEDDSFRPEGYSQIFDLAMVYYHTKNYDLAIPKFLRQVHIFDEIGDQLFKSSMLNNVGLCYFNLKEYSNARDYFNKALVELSKPNKNGFVSDKKPGYNNYFEKVIKSNIAKIEVIEGNYNHALISFMEELKVSKSFQEYPIITNAYLSLGKVYFLKNNAPLAQKYLDSVFLAMSPFDNTDTKIEAFELQGKIQLLEGNLKSATKSFESQKTLQDSILKVRINRDAMMAAIKYDTENREKELIASKQELIVQERLEKHQWIALTVAMLLLLLTGIMFLKSYRDKITIANQKDILQDSLQEKKTLLKEVHHRVKNNLQVVSGLLQLQSKKVNSKEMNIVLTDAQRQIHSMSLVHEMLYQQDKFAKIPMQEYLEKLVHQILFSLSGKNIHTEIDAGTIELGIDSVIPLGLILSELITNTNKYAYDTDEGIIKITLHIEQDEEIIFQYQDFGKGLPQDFKEHLSETMGLQLIHMLSEEINGNIVISGQEGMSVLISFKE